MDLKSKLQQFSDPTSKDFTANLRKIVFDDAASYDSNDYYSLIDDSSNSIIVRFAAFYCMFTQYRRFEHRYHLFNLVDKYMPLFDLDILSYLVNIVRSQYCKFKFLDSLNKIYFLRALEYAEKAIYQYNNGESQNIGCFNNYADIVLDSISAADIASEDQISMAIRNVDRAIYIQERERGLPPYANYYCSKARLYAHQENFLEAKKMILLAISYERTDQRDSLIRISNYHNIQLEIKTSEALKIIDSSVTSSNERFQGLHDQLEQQQSKYIEILGFFATTIALLIGTISITLNSISFAHACALVLVLSGCLVFSYVALKFLFSTREEIYRILIISLLSMLLIVVGIGVGINVKS